MEPKILDSEATVHRVHPLQYASTSTVLHHERVIQEKDYQKSGPRDSDKHARKSILTDPGPTDVRTAGTTLFLFEKYIALQGITIAY